MGRRRIDAEQLRLQRYAPATPGPTPPPGALSTNLFERQEAQRAFRQRFGRSISMEKIEIALRQAHRGSMQSLTDLSRETLDTDPHLAAVVNKRLGAVSSLPIEVIPATGSGEGFNQDKAMFYAEVVREQIRKLEDIHQSLYQLAWALYDGRSALEKIWTRLQPGEGTSSSEFGEAEWAIANLAWIHPRRLSFGPERELRVVDEVRSHSGGNFSAIGLSLGEVPFKFLWWLPQLFGEYPEREGLAPRVLYWSFFKRFAARERMILTELFGKPWRILQVDEESSASAEDLTAADEIVDQLGASFSARMPRGTKLEVVSPEKSAGEVHQQIIAESDRQMSKLVLGQTGTTDSVPAGLNNNQANVMQDEQLGILIFDATRMSEVIETQLADEIIALNFGWPEVTHAPRIRLRSDLPADRKAELTRLDLALKSGLPVARDEAYQVSGFRVPNEDEPIVKVEQPPTPPLAPVPPAVRPIIVYPPDQSPPAGEQQPAAPEASTDEGARTEPTAQVGAADAAMTITVNEDRAARGLEPLTRPDGSPDPDGDLTIAEFEARRVDSEDEEIPNGAAPSIAQAPQLQREDVHDGSHLEGPEHGPGGAHVHDVDRQRLSTLVGGPHRHAFLLSDGRLFFTELDGVHQHRLGSTDAEQTEQGGEHFHSITIDGMTLQTSATISAHEHTLLVSATGLDGVHPHALEIPDPEGGDPTSARSLSPGEFAQMLIDGFIDPAQIPADVIGQGERKKRKRYASTAVHCRIRQLPSGKYRVESDDGERSFGEFDTLEEAQERLRQIERFRDAEAGGPGAKAFPALLARLPEDSVLALSLAAAVQDAAHDAASFKQFISSGCAHCKGEQVSCVRDHKQPSTPNGSPETILERSLSGMRSAMRKLADEFKAGVRGRDTVAGIFGALNRTREQLDTRPVARELERRMVQAAGLGAIDNALEIALDTDEPGEQRVEEVVERGGEIAQTVEEAQASRVLAQGETDFSRMPFAEAVRNLRERNVVSRAVFDRLSAQARNRAFTVSGVLGDQALRVLQAELATAVQQGRELRDFQKFIDQRLRSAGFLAQVVETPSGRKAFSSSHVETVFRTNTLNAYNAGRAAHASQPEILRARPVWEWRATIDTETRSAHATANGKRVLATDPIWQTVYAPAGYNCRCRVVTRGRDAIATVQPGTVALAGLPDPGFTSGARQLI